MTKSEFTDQVASSNGLSKKDAESAVEAVLEGIQGVLKGGGEVNLTGFGKFHVAERGARQGKHPAHRRADPDRRFAGSPLQRRRQAQAGRQGLTAPSRSGPPGR